MEKKENHTTRYSGREMCLTVADDYSEHQFRALRIVSGFRAIGIRNFVSFYAEIKESYPSSETIGVHKKLQQFWYLRNFDLEMIERLEVILDNLISSN